jgi:hypothetical protein
MKRIIYLCLLFSLRRVLLLTNFSLLFLLLCIIYAKFVLIKVQRSWYNFALHFIMFFSTFSSLLGFFFTSVQEKTEKNRRTNETESLTFSAFFSSSVASSFSLLWFCFDVGFKKKLLSVIDSENDVF